MLFSLFYVQTAYAGGSTPGGKDLILVLVGGLIVMFIAVYCLTIGKKET